MRVWRNRKRTLARFLRRFPFSQQLLRGAAGFVGGRFTAGVVGVVLDGEGRILIVEHVFHPRHPWGLPGGWLHAGERPAEGLAREIAEETGLRVEVLHPLLIDTSRHGSRHLDIAFLCTPRGDVTALSRELLSYEWVRPGEMPLMVDFHQAAVNVLLEQDFLVETTA